MDKTMIVRLKRFNIYLLCAMLAPAALSGCKASHKKPGATFRLHLQANPDAGRLTQTISVFRQAPVTFTVEREPFLTEKNVAEAKVIDVMGGFDLSVRFDRQGSWLLNSYTVGNRGLYCAIFSQWTEEPEGKLNRGRWLAAQKIVKSIGNGVVTFTPDTTREEAEQIATGLNNVAKKLKTASESNW